LVKIDLGNIWGKLFINQKRAFLGKIDLRYVKIFSDDTDLSEVFLQHVGVDKDSNKMLSGKFSQPIQIQPDAHKVEKDKKIENIRQLVKVQTATLYDPDNE
jgi:hypothetical protein